METLVASRVYSRTEWNEGAAFIALDSTALYSVYWRKRVAEPCIYYSCHYWQYENKQNKINHEVSVESVKHEQRKECIWMLSDTPLHYSRKSRQCHRSINCNIVPMATADGGDMFLPNFISSKVFCNDDESLFSWCNTGYILLLLRAFSAWYSSSSIPSCKCSGIGRLFAMSSRRWRCCNACFGRRGRVCSSALCGWLYCWRIPRPRPRPAAERASSGFNSFEYERCGGTTTVSSNNESISRRKKPGELLASEDGDDLS